MNWWLPLVGFYWRHGAQINAMIPKSGTGEQASLVLDVATAMVPIIKKHWPQLNAEGLCDDALTTLREVLAPPTA
jgi:hypothetical protein